MTDVKKPMEFDKIAGILKNFPKGTKLYSPIFGDVTLEEVEKYNIKVMSVDFDDILVFNQNGSYHYRGECMLFPSKENRDWDKFSPFKDGDIVVAADGVLTQMFILKDFKSHENDSYDEEGDEGDE